jgi:hypothetical protein
MDIPPEIAERRVDPSEVSELREWIERTRALAATGLLRPDIGELAELLEAIAVNGTRARRGERGWDVRRDDGGHVQVKAVWHLPHRRRQNLGRITNDFAGDILGRGVQSRASCAGGPRFARRPPRRQATTGPRSRWWDPGRKPDLRG